ncbi:MAG: FAD-dependent oxidoreductase [Candidatus Latescibacteria bacterium]|jgi:hypothetical protein|nr:FAD-dependent oxidoreductase [Candidatus Latescibacterota bacterium]
MGERSADVVIIGGGIGGCAAALAAARCGKTVVMTEETDWVGGQLTQQAVPPDEHRWIESFGATRTYRTYREGVRAYYRRHYPLTAAARSRWNLNPGNGWVSRLCHEPRVSLAVLEGMLASYRSTGQVEVLLHSGAVSAATDGDLVRSVTVRHLLSGHETVLVAPYFLDATELGDLLPLTGTEYVTGFESQAETGEPHAPSEAQPENMQSFTCCFAVDHVPGEDHTIEKPATYGFWRDYVPELTPAWPGRLLDWAYSHPPTLEPITLDIDPEGDGGRDFWVYRRIIHRRNFEAGAYASDICLVNWPQIDYWLGNLCEVEACEAAEHLARAKQLSLSMLYWMQTEAPRPDGGTGWPGLRLRRDIVGTEDGLAKYPYIRESRRIRAEFTVTERHVGTDARMAVTDESRDAVRAEAFPDSVGVGYYGLDLHPSSGGDNYIDIGCLPFQIPLGTLIHQRVENLLPACKNLGVTHIANGCYRLHPVEWNIGESAGALAAFCLDRKARPRQVRNDEKLLGEFQSWIMDQGVEIEWPSVGAR